VSSRRFGAGRRIQQCADAYCREQRRETACEFPAGNRIEKHENLLAGIDCIFVNVALVERSKIAYSRARIVNGFNGGKSSIISREAVVLSREACMQANRRLRGMSYDDWPNSKNGLRRFSLAVLF
jgi:hypothetical protein